MDSLPDLIKKDLCGGVPLKLKNRPTTSNELVSFFGEYSMKEGIRIDAVLEAKKFYSYYFVEKVKLCKDWKARARRWVLNCRTFGSEKRLMFSDIWGESFVDIAKRRQE